MTWTFYETQYNCNNCKLQVSLETFLNLKKKTVFRFLLYFYRFYIIVREFLKKSAVDNCFTILNLDKSIDILVNIWKINKNVRPRFGNLKTMWFQGHTNYVDKKFHVDQTKFKVGINVQSPHFLLFKTVVCKLLI